LRVVGVLLVAALMVLPVGAAQRLARSFRQTLMAASAIGTFSAICGLTVARAFGLAPGGAVVLVAAACFVMAAAWKAPGRPHLLMTAAPRR
jgi:zinc transport system permease protein